MCIGKNLAMQEMRACLARLVLTFDMELPEYFDINAFRQGLRHMRTTFYIRPLLVKMTRQEGRTTPIGVL